MKTRKTKGKPVYPRKLEKVAIATSGECNFFFLNDKFVTQVLKPAQFKVAKVANATFALDLLTLLFERPYRFLTQRKVTWRWQRACIYNKLWNELSPLHATVKIF